LLRTTLTPKLLVWGVTGFIKKKDVLISALTILLFWNALGENRQILINDQFMADQALRGKNFTFTLSNPLFPGLGSEREMKWLNKLVGEGIYEKVRESVYKEALQHMR
jgi:hypothetical protein